MNRRMGMTLGLNPNGFARRIIAVGLIAAIFQVPAAGQTPAPSRLLPPKVGERVDVERLDGRHVLGTVEKKLRDRIAVQPPGGTLEFIHYSDVRVIHDLDTGTMVGIPWRPTRPGDWLKIGAVVGAFYLGFFFFRLTGCVGHCNY
jgi:hypothetical protein